MVVVQEETMPTARECFRKRGRDSFCGKVDKCSFLPPTAVSPEIRLLQRREIKNDTFPTVSDAGAVKGVTS